MCRTHMLVSRARVRPAEIERMRGTHTLAGSDRAREILLSRKYDKQRAALTH